MRTETSLVLLGLLVLAGAARSTAYVEDEFQEAVPYVGWQDYVLLACSLVNGIGMCLFLAPKHFPMKKLVLKQLGDPDTALNRWAGRCFSVQMPFLIFFLVTTAGGHARTSAGSSRTPSSSSSSSQELVHVPTTTVIDLPSDEEEPVFAQTVRDAVDSFDDDEATQLEEGEARVRRYYLTILNLVCVLVLRRLLDLLRNNFQQVWELEDSAEERDILEFTPPPLALLSAKVLPMMELFNPQVFDIDNVPATGPCLLVGNHALFGLDMPLLLHSVYKSRGVYVRGLADHLHFTLPGWSALLSYFGAVDGTPRNCAALLGSGCHVLVYPGGAREVVDNAYELKWGNRLGFVRQACKNNSPIVPVATVGTNEMLDIVHRLPLGWLIGREDLSLPVLKPNLTIQRIYYKFGTPIEPRDFFPSSQIDLDNQEALLQIRDRVKLELERLIAELQEFQSNDPQRFFTERRRGDQTAEKSD